MNRDKAIGRTDLSFSPFSETRRDEEKGQREKTLGKGRRSTHML